MDSTKQYYYSDFRFHYRHRWPARPLNESVPEMIQVDEEDRVFIRQKLSSKTGFTGLRPSV